MTCLICACQKITQVHTKKPLDYKGAAISNIKLGINYLKENKISTDKERFLLALKQAPELPAAWYGMAYFQEATGNITEATRDYQYAIRLAPRDGAAHNNYGTFLCRHKHYKAAVDQFLLATKESDYLNVASAYENAGFCSVDEKDKIKYFQLAIKNNPNQLDSWMQLAKLSRKKGDNTMAEYYLSHYNDIKNNVSFNSEN